MKRRKAKNQVMLSVNSDGIKFSIVGPLGYQNPDKTTAMGPLESVVLTPQEALRIGLLLIDSARCQAGGITNLPDPARKL